MITTQELLIILISVVTIFICLITFLIFNLTKKLSPTFGSSFSSYNSKKHFYMANFYDDVYEFLSQLERINEITLSEEAKQLLILPLIEYQRASKNSNSHYKDYFIHSFDNWRNSIIKIIENIKHEPAQFDIDMDKNNLKDEVRTSMSVIKAYADKFCNIPPFCGEKK